MKNFKKVKSSGYGQKRKKSTTKLNGRMNQSTINQEQFSVLGLARKNHISVDEVISTDNATRENSVILEQNQYKRNSKSKNHI